MFKVCWIFIDRNQCDRNTGQSMMFIAAFGLLQVCAFLFAAQLVLLAADVKTMQCKSPDLSLSCSLTDTLSTYTHTLSHTSAHAHILSSPLSKFKYRFASSFYVHAVPTVHVSHVAV